MDAPSNRPNGRNKERRAGYRYQISLPIKLSTASEQIPQTWNAVTQDISVGGFYLKIDKQIRPGLEIDVRLILPSQLIQGPEVLVLVRGKVLRVEKLLEASSDRLGVAIATEKFDLIRPKS